MTKARKAEPKPEKKLKPKLSKETVKDLDVKGAEDVKGGRIGACTERHSACIHT